MVFLVNLSEKDYIRQKNKHLPKIAEWVKEHATGDPIIPLSICFEERLTRFDTEAEVEEECKKLGTKSALPKIVVTMRQALNLGSFFTTGTDEVRQWTVRNGTKAPQAAGVIHGGTYLVKCATFKYSVCVRFRENVHSVYSVQLRRAKGGWRRSSGQGGG